MAALLSGGGGLKWGHRFASGVNWTRLVIVAAAVVLAAAGCVDEGELVASSSSGLDGEQGDGDPDGTDGPSATTDAPLRRPTASDPLRVILAGDSVMAGLAPALDAAFGSSGAIESRFILTPSVIRDPAARFTWERQVTEFSPEVVVMLLGTWEAMIIEGEQRGEGSATSTTSSSGAVVVDPADTERWIARYKEDLLVPWVDMMTDDGAQLVWVGMPAIAPGAASSRIEAMNEAISELAAQRDDLVFVDPSVVEGPDGEMREVLEMDGRPRRVRQVDGLHLCPAGAELLAGEVLGVLDSLFVIPFGEGWRDPTWYDNQLSSGALTYPPEACPADTEQG